MKQVNWEYQVYQVPVLEHICEHVRAITTLGFWGSELPLLWPSLERSHVLTTWGSSSDSSRLAASGHTQHLAHQILVPFGSIWFHIPGTLWISIGSAVMQVLSVIRLDSIVAQVGKRQFPVKTFYDFYDMALTNIISAENNYILLQLQPSTSRGHCCSWPLPPEGWLVLIQGMDRGGLSASRIPMYIYI